MMSADQTLTLNDFGIPMGVWTDEKYISSATKSGWVGGIKKWKLFQLGLNLEKYQEIPGIQFEIFHVRSRNVQHVPKKSRFSWRPNRLYMKFPDNQLCVTVWDAENIYIFQVGVVFWQYRGFYREQLRFHAKIKDRGLHTSWHYHDWRPLLNKLAHVSSFSFHGILYEGPQDIVFSSPSQDDVSFLNRSQQPFRLYRWVSVGGFGDGVVRHPDGRLFHCDVSQTSYDRSKNSVNEKVLWEPDIGCLYVPDQYVFKSFQNVQIKVEDVRPYLGEQEERHQSKTRKVKPYFDLSFA